MLIYLIHLRVSASIRGSSLSLSLGVSVVHKKTSAQRGIVPRCGSLANTNYCLDAGPALAAEAFLMGG
jgi:hypothetical protein